MTPGFSGTPAGRGELPRVIVAGAGFGGLAAARELARAPVQVTVIDRHNYHLFQPLLYQVATAALSPADIAEPIRVVLRRQQNATVLLDEILGIDTGARRVELRFGVAREYDYLVLATGSQYTYFGHNDWPRLAPGLKSIDDATLIRRRMLLAFEEAETISDPVIRQRLLTFVLVGAGPTGVEMAGALAELAHSTLSRDFRHINPGTAHILLVEAGPRVLSGFPERLAAFARYSLERMGVEVVLDTPIEAIDQNGVVARGRRIEAANVIWCAGVEASPVAQWLGLPAGKGGRVRVAPDLSMPGHPELFVIGDAALVVGPKGEPLPGLAPVAKQQGQYVGALIARRALGEPAPQPFRYRDEGALATIGRHSAIADLGWIRLTGFAAWVLWGVVHIFFLIGFRNRMAVFL
ncbi:MAG: NAD(P)/FAD-dependent oxidoreductase, partial [Alphaproteobacteria bacterium]|nr:NAD(P)/FAD-dependent oxidoreductase [Alphaproteobacteria bacterium]